MLEAGEVEGVVEGVVWYARFDAAGVEEGIHAVIAPRDFSDSRRGDEIPGVIAGQCILITSVWPESANGNTRRIVALLRYVRDSFCMLPRRVRQPVAGFQGKRRI